MFNGILMKEINQSSVLSVSINEIFSNNNIS